MKQDKIEKLKGFGAVAAIAAIFALTFVIRESSKDSARSTALEATSDADEFELMEAPDSRPKVKKHLSEKMIEQQGEQILDKPQEVIENVAANQPIDSAKPCTEVDRVLNRPWCDKQIPTAQKEPSNNQNTPSASSVKKDQRAGSKKSGVNGEAKDLLAWGKISKEKPSVIEGRNKVYAGRVIKAGCEILVVLQNEVVAIPGTEHIMKLNARGALDNCLLPKSDGIQFLATGKLMPNDTYIEAMVTTCTDRQPTSKSVNCKASRGRVLSISGSQALEGAIYDNTGWGIFWEAVVAIGMTPAVAKLTETAANAKTIFQSTSATSIADTLTKTLDRVSQKISAQFDKKEVRITPLPRKPVTMIVVFEKDVVLN